jgi:hypothetical protein
MQLIEKSIKLTKLFSKLFSSLGSSAFDYVPSVLGAHSTDKTVFFFGFFNFWLKCPFWHKIKNRNRNFDMSLLLLFYYLFFKIKDNMFIGASQTRSLALLRLLC